MAGSRFSLLVLTFLLLASCQRNLVRDSVDEGPRVNGVAVHVLDSLLESVSRPLGGTASACVLRLSNGQVLWEYDSWRRMLPASSQKVMVAAVLLQELGPQTQFVTGWYRRGVLTDSTLQGSLVLMGGGDPALGRNVDSAWFDSVATRLVGMGIDTITGNLVVRDPYLAPSDWPWPGSWDFDNSYSSCYGAPSTGLSYGGNCPHDSSFTDPLAQVGQLQLAALQRANIVVNGNVQVEKGMVADSSDTLLLEKKSARLDTLLRDALFRSSNHDMETFGLVLGKGDSVSIRENGMRSMRRSLHAWGLDTTRNHLQDMSGMSRKNLVTAQDMAIVLQRFFADTSSPISALLPGPGEGTLSTRFAQGLPAGTHLHAKTGSLDGVSALVGMLEPVQGDSLVFVLLFNGYTGGSAPVRAVQDQIVALLAGQVLQPALAQQKSSPR